MTRELLQEMDNQLRLVKVAGLMINVRSSRTGPMRALRKTFNDCRSSHCRFTASLLGTGTSHRRRPSKDRDPRGERHLHLQHMCSAMFNLSQVLNTTSSACAFISTSVSSFSSTSRSLNSANFSLQSSLKAAM